MDIVIRALKAIGVVLGIPMLVTLLCCVALLVVIGVGWLIARFLPYRF
jgi:hypothetical protein